MPHTKIPLISREDLKAKLDRGDDFVLVEPSRRPTIVRAIYPRRSTCHRFR